MSVGSSVKTVRSHVAKILRRATLLSLVVGIATYLWFAIPYWWNSPVITKRYVSDFNHEVAKIPVEQRAWPLLRKARILDPIPDEATFPKGAPTSTCWDDPQLGAAVKFLDERRESVELIRTAASQARLGALLWCDSESLLDPSKSAQERIASVPNVDLDASPWMLSLVYQYMGTIRSSARLLALDMCVAGEQGDAARCLGDFKAMLGLARLVSDPPVLIGQLVGVAVESFAVNRLETVAATYPALFSTEDWKEIDRVLAKGSYFSQGPEWEWEKQQLDDWAQRIFAPGSSGGMTAEGYRFLGAGGSQPSSEFEVYVLGPASATRFGTRADFDAFRDQMFAAAASEAKKPAYLRDEAWRIELETQSEKPGAPRSSRVLAILLPSLNNAMFAVDKVKLEFETARVIAHIEQFRLKHERYPANPSELRDAIGGELPQDIFSGRPICCQFVEDGLRLYSVGVDRVDDGGTPGRNDEVVQKWKAASELAGLSERQFEAYQGDWILWPPREVEWADGSRHALAVSKRDASNSDGDQSGK